jgi:hypothetical protein
MPTIQTRCVQITGGWFIFLRKGQGCVSAKSGQSPDVALSSTESETIWACSAATQGATSNNSWMNYVFSDLSLLNFTKIPSQQLTLRKETSLKVNSATSRRNIITSDNSYMMVGLRWLKLILKIKWQTWQQKSYLLLQRCDSLKWFLDILDLMVTTILFLRRIIGGLCQDVITTIIHVPVYLLVFSTSTTIILY